jgi:hypothetical protein
MRIKKGIPEVIPICIVRCIVNVSVERSYLSCNYTFHLIVANKPG